MGGGFLFGGLYIWGGLPVSPLSVCVVCENCRKLYFEGVIMTLAFSPPGTPQEVKEGKPAGKLLLHTMDALDENVSLRVFGLPKNLDQGIV